MCCILVISLVLLEAILIFLIDLRCEGPGVKAPNRKGAKQTARLCRLIPKHCCKLLLGTCVVNVIMPNRDIPSPSDLES